MQYKIKLVIIGEPGVGKTSLVKKLVTGQFSKDYKASIGTNMFIKEQKIDSGGNSIDIILQLWDIAGQERWINMRHLYYAGTQAAIIVGDLTRKRTFDQIEMFWYPDLVKYCGKIPFILIANKHDIEKEITEDELDILVKKIKPGSFFYTSAKNGMNVDEAFVTISKQVINVL